MTDPLLDMKTLPEYDRINPAGVGPAIRRLLGECRDTVTRVAGLNAGDADPTWESLVDPIEESLDGLSRAWDAVGLLNSVTSGDELRRIHDELLPEVAAFYTWLGQNRDLYGAYLRLSRSEGFARLSPERRRAVAEELKDFELSGVSLPAEQREILAGIDAELAELSSKFSNNVLDATGSFVRHVTDAAELAGLPPSDLALAEREARSRGLGGYVLTLQLPSYLAVMKHADCRALRREMYEAYVTRASELGPDAGKFDNAGIIERELDLAARRAELLGFPTAAHLSLARKMARSPAEVTEFLEGLAARCREQGRREAAEIYAYAKKLRVTYEPEPWDLTYLSEKLKKERYAVTDEEIRPYFPLPKVLDGLFGLARALFGAEIRPRAGVPVWHPDAAYYDVYRDGVRAGGFYTDLYAREKKRGGAWMEGCSGRRVRPGGALQLPVACVVANFKPPVGDKPALLSHDEVETLFHEFGHALHHVLTAVDTGQLAGINRVPWDAVEVPSQFMENFTWQPEVLAMISGHVDTGEPLPEETLGKLVASRNYHSAMAMLRQIEFALFDFRCFLERGNGKTPQEILDEVRRDVSVVPVAPFNRFQDSFLHIFAGGYSAGYYSYKWAEVLSADAFGRFEEEGILSPAAGRDFARIILGSGGSRDFMDLFREFRGREPSAEALLRHSGIAP